MEGIILKSIDPEKFFELTAKLDKLNANVEKLVNKKFQEKLTPEEVANLQNCTVQTVYSQIKKGILPARKVGRKLVIKRSDLEQALKEVKSLKYKR